MTNEDILRQADRLMKRHRVFVAVGAHTDGPEATARDGEELPVLTEVVAASPAHQSGPSTEPIAALAKAMLFERLPGLRQALAGELDTWLDGELPAVVMRVLDGITDQLVAQVTLEAKAALLPRLQAALESDAPPTDTEG